MRTLIAILLLLAAPGIAEAQRARAEIIDSAGVPIDEVLATLTDTAGVTIRTGRSDAGGVVHLLAPRPGTYRVSFARIGFNPYTTGGLVLREGETLVIEVRMQARPQALATMKVKARTRREFGREGWAERKALGKGVFLTGDEIRAENALTVAEALGTVEGFQVRYRPLPELSTLRGNRCLQYMVNSLLMPLVPDQHPSETLDRVLGADKVMGIEVYREYNEVPPVFRSRAVQTVPPDDRVSPIPRRRGSEMTPDTESTRNCGLINIWTRRAW
jgi:hypothetical protein